MATELDKRGAGILLKSSFWYLFSTVLLNGISFLVTPFFTRMMSLDEYGQYNNYSSWEAIFSIFITFNLSVTILSAYGDYKANMRDYYFSMCVFMLGLSSVFAVIAVVFNEPLHAWTSLDTKYLLLIIAYSIGNSILSLFQSQQRMEFRYKTSTAITIAVALSKTLLAIIFVVLMEEKAFARVLGNTIPIFVFGILLFLFYAKNSDRLNVSYWKYALPLAIPYIPHTLSMTLLNSMDKTMITNICGNEYTAIYSVAYTCGSIVIVILMALNTAYSPWLREKIELNQPEKVRKFSYIYIGIGVCICIGVILFAPEIILLFGGAKYSQAVYVLPPIALGCMMQFLYTMFVNIEQIQKHTFEMAVASCIAALVNLVLNFILIPKLGYIAAAYTTLIGYLVLLFIHMYVIKRIKMEKYYNYRFIFFVAAIMLGLGTIINLVYENIILRIILILFVTAVIIVISIKIKLVDKLFSLKTK